MELQLMELVLVLADLAAGLVRVKTVLVTQVWAVAELVVEAEPEILARAWVRAKLGAEVVEAEPEIRAARARGEADLMVERTAAGLWEPVRIKVELAVSGKAVQDAMVAAVSTVSLRETLEVKAAEVQAALHLAATARSAARAKAQACPPQERARAIGRAA